ncbi:hypothetical protein HCJ93_08500 [Streptomyces sp. SBST2-5]|uniref:Transcriptional regulator n=1 Tax=Streptomyces composti TaxID=2720025 RepID=A0ABX1A1J8_9ACTN|nr:hypothetical protein [Streptomyces composti]NJP50110.1 hypothetical protein [Streptomyces composti]
MAVSRQMRKAWGSKLETLTEKAQKAREDLLVGIYQARQAGLSQADVAYSIGGVSPTGIKAKEEKGREIYERRKGGSSPS